MFKEVFSANWLFQLFFKVTDNEAIVLNQTVYYRDSKGIVGDNVYLRCHEMCHVLQMQERDVLFYWSYLRHLVSKGSEHHPDEIEAILFGDYQANFYRNGYEGIITPDAFIRKVFNRYYYGNYNRSTHTRVRQH